MSVKGCGKNFPDPAGAEKLDDGVLVPCGKSQDNSLHFKSSLLYNEVAMCVGLSFSRQYSRRLMGL